MSNDLREHVRRNLHVNACTDDDCWCETLTHVAMAVVQPAIDALQHLLEHWADEHMILKVVGDSDGVHADWCYRCRVERAEATIERSRKAIAAFDGRGTVALGVVGSISYDVPTAGEVLAAWRASLDQPKEPR